jgi:hypothetical protein
VTAEAEATLAAAEAQEAEEEEEDEEGHTLPLFFLCSFCAVTP